MVTKIYTFAAPATVDGNYPNTTGFRIQKAGLYHFEATGTYDGADVNLYSKQTNHPAFSETEGCELVSGATRAPVELAEDEEVYAVVANDGASTSLTITLVLIEQF